MANYKYFAGRAWIGIAEVEDPQGFGPAAAERAFQRWVEDLDFKDFSRELPINKLDQPGMEDHIGASDVKLDRTKDTIIVTDAEGGYDIRF
jgi:hypothetical protein